MLVSNDQSVRLDLSDKAEIEKWCCFLKCDEETLRYCISNVGRSIVSVESFLSMNRDWINTRENTGDDSINI